MPSRKGCRTEHRAAATLLCGAPLEMAKCTSAPGGIPKRDLHAAEMFIANCCPQRRRRRCRCRCRCPCPRRLSSGRTQMSTAQSADVYIESHFGCQTTARAAGAAAAFAAAVLGAWLMKSANRNAMHFISI